MSSVKGTVAEELKYKSHKNQYAENSTAECQPSACKQIKSVWIHLHFAEENSYKLSRNLKILKIILNIDARHLKEILLKFKMHSGTV